MKLVELSLIVDSREDDLEIVQEVTTPVTVIVDHMRSFNKRKHDKPGTRITFANSAAIVVTESYDEVKRLVTPRAR